jgi:uncharacterized protein (TIGR02145 family)
LGTADSYSRSYDSKNRGINFSGELGEDQMIWYSESGYRISYSGELDSVGSNGRFWSCSPTEGGYAYYWCINMGNVHPSNNYNRPNGYSVRCVRE